MTLWLIAGLLLVGTVLANSRLCAAGPSSKRPAKTESSGKPEPPIAAMVDDEPVYSAEVDDILVATPRAKTAVREAPAGLRDAALAQAINRRLVARYLAAEGYTVNEAEADDLIKELKRKLDTQGITFDEFLSRHGFNELMVRRRLTWDAMWAGYLANEANDKGLEDYFERHRSDYDGRELRVSHILWQVKATDGASKLASATQEAEEVRARIVEGKLSFGAAAEKYSAGPSGRHEGDLGFIPRHDRMTEAFSRAAFELMVGEISKPVVDQFGVHLIQCTEIKPGQKSWRDVRRELVETFARDRFIELADQQRKKVNVKIVETRP
ncbi:MAG TPA: peptidylprolyl isomerase [Pirellulales bacterium]|nr:peptidylprolyl isomerase [Pirellulales bacterium]